MADSETPRTVLAHLLEAVQPPEELAERLADLRRRLGEEPDDAPFDALLRDAATLVTEIFLDQERQRRELSAFLAELTRRFHEMETLLQSTEQMTGASFQGGQKARVALERQIDDMESRVRGAANPEQMRSTVHHRIGLIRNQIDHEYSQRAVQFTGLHGQLTSLESGLRALSLEAAGMRARLGAVEPQSLVDPLTGLPNRVAGERRLRQEYARWKRYASPLVMQLWRVDGLDAVEGEHGRQAVDRALVLMAQLLTGGLRETDYLVRHDEAVFAVLLTETALETAETVAARLRGVIADTHFHYHGTPVSITVSTGAAALTEGDTPKSLTERAEQVLATGRSDSPP
ncbi:MAG TPA: GGDEF domain-containing protein [Acidiferrobacterales bacterium]|jgi:diguanylate cyclase